MNGILGYLAVAGFAALVGAATSVYVVFLSSSGERSRFQGELAPLRAAIADVADRFEHWTKRERRRDFVSAPNGPATSFPAPVGARSRRERLAELRGRRSVGISQKA